MPLLPQMSLNSTQVRDAAYLASLTQYLHELPLPDTYPWERRRETSIRRHAKRRLLDSYGDSLRRVNRLMELEFGHHNRMVLTSFQWRSA